MMATAWCETNTLRNHGLLKIRPDMSHFEGHH